jgi:hypothetical protein
VRFIEKMKSLVQPDELLPDFLREPPELSRSQLSGAEPFYLNSNLPSDEVMSSAIQLCDHRQLLSIALGSPGKGADIASEAKRLFPMDVSNEIFRNRDEAVTVKRELAHRLNLTPKPERPSRYAAPASKGMR